MLIHVMNTDYSIYFRQSKGTGITTCFLTPDDGPEFVAEAQCSRKDRFHSRTGKKVALLKAMRDEMGLSKERRTEIWVEYLVQTKDPCVMIG